MHPSTDLSPLADFDLPVPTAANDAEPVIEQHQLAFTGSGKEYFRIWIVNLLLTVATLGVYSAWAKVRRLQYFDRNTVLAGSVFDFDGNPHAILRGRVAGVVLLAAYQYAFGFSLAAGIAVVAFLLLALPVLMRGALRFRLVNTRYRGLRFGFDGSVAGAYRVYLAPTLTLLLPSALLALDHSGRWAAASLLLYLLWPLMHGAGKRYQQRHLRFGNAAASTTLSPHRFYGPYLMATAWSVAALIVVGIGSVLLAGMAKAAGVAPSAGQSTLIGAMIGAASAYLAYLMAGPYLGASLANRVWSHTSLPNIRIISALPVRGFVWLQVQNTVLTLASLGLYRPFAVVRTYRYRLAHVALQVDGSFEHILAGAARRPGGGADGVADFLGLDLSW